MVQNTFLKLLRKIGLVAFVMGLFCVNGCSQSSSHNFRAPGKIPIDGKRWYIVNNTSQNLEWLFNSKEKEKPNMGYGLMLENYDAYYPLANGEKMTIDSIMLFDWEGTNEEHPMTIFAITEDWKRIPIAVFTGQRYNAWNGPDPAKPDVFALPKPVTNIRYLAINSSGDFPGEIEFYGTYTEPTPEPSTAIKYAPLRNFFGVNAFEWDFEEPNAPFQPDPVRLRGIQNFTGIRHYLDWDKIEGKEGTYNFSPAYSGGWNYDTIYQWCQANNIDVVACLKTIPEWIQNTYPEDERDNENIPLRYGKDPQDPRSYMEQARAAFQFAARYGKNKTIDVSLIKVAPDNLPRMGLGTVLYIECDNERDKWWKGRKAYQTGREYAANLSAFYDGHKNKLGPGVGVKNADPAMKVVMAGLAMPSPDYVRGMIDWSREHRGTRPDGSPDLPWDVINYHYYCNDADYETSKTQTKGVAPELTRAETVAGEFVKLGQQYGMPVWVTEAGYDINPESPQAAKNTGDRSVLGTQADWLMRTSLLYSRAGIQKVFYYELVDDNPKLNTQFATSGLINMDRSNRPVTDYFHQTSRLFGNYSYTETISKDPLIDKYTWNGKTMYMLVIPDQNNRKTKYTVDLGSADTAFVYKPATAVANMDLQKIKTKNGKVEVGISETPLFITSYDCQTNTPTKK